MFTLPNFIRIGPLSFDKIPKGDAKFKAIFILGDDPQRPVLVVNSSPSEKGDIAAFDVHVDRQNLEESSATFHLALFEGEQALGVSPTLHLGDQSLQVWQEMFFSLVPVVFKVQLFPFGSIVPRLLCSSSCSFCLPKLPKRRACEYCAQKGRLNCLECSGQAELPCADCDGRGFSLGTAAAVTAYGAAVGIFQRVICSGCYGQKTIVCVVCQGLGSLRCPQCAGHGHINCRCKTGHDEFL